MLSSKELKDTMKKSEFLRKTERGGKIKLVEVSDRVKESYLQKSTSNLESAKILLKEGKFEESVALIYYSMYNSLMALLFKIGIKSENHSASIMLMKEIFGLDNSKIEFAKKERLDKQYYIDFHVTKKDVEELIGIAEEFSSYLYNFLEKIKNEEVKRFRDKFKEMFKK